MAAAAAPVHGRFVRVEAPASSRMGIYEIEIWSGGRNLALNNRTLKFAGTGFRGSDINLRNERWQMFDGAVDFNQRSCELSTAGGVNPWLEIDLGATHPVEKLVVNQPLKPLYDDRAVRLVSVLDEGRHVVWAAVYDLRRAPCHQGVATFAPAAGAARLVGRVVPSATAQWAPLGEVLTAEPATRPPEAPARAARFARRNHPESIAELAREFFARVDLTKPALAGVREKFDRGEFAAALDAYRDHFLQQLQGVVFMHEGASEVTGYDAAAADLLRGIAVAFARYDVAAQEFAPGAIDWAAVPRDSDDRQEGAERGGGVALARTRAKAGNLQLPLLASYRDTGRGELLAQWAAITDDWGMHIRGDLERAARGGHDLRCYFVKTEIQEFNRLADELAQTARQRPEFARQLPGATLARLLIPVLEEYLPAYWWVCRRATFNHTYNALNAATVTSRLLDDFHAGQRLDHENRQHWQRVWSMNMTRDGSMNEIGDEGHMFMQWRMGTFFRQMQKTPPPWFTPDFAAEFETGWRQTTTYPLRHLAPDGFGHRLGSRDYYYIDRFWWLADPKSTAMIEIGGYETLDSTPILRQPEVAGILQSVFGAGRDRETLAPPRQAMRDVVTGYYGTRFTPPTTISDWMPYAGLYYLRRSWEPDATYVHMIAQPMGHPSTNGSAWNTEFHYFDFGQPLLACGPVWVDGQPPFNEAATLTYKPGSKTESLATASEFPIPARWHTSPRLDYAESFFEGTYQEHRTKTGKDYAPLPPLLGNSPVEGTRADRRVVLFRPARLVIVTDAVRPPESAKPRHYEVRQRFALPGATGKQAAKPGTFHGDAATLTLVNADAPGVTVRRFTTARLSWDRRKTPDSWERPNELGGPGGAAMMDHTGVLENRGGILRADTRGPLLMSALLEPHRTTGNAVVQNTTDLSGEGVTGFQAALRDGARLTWLATGGDARALAAGEIELQGEALLLYYSGAERSGIILGGRSLRINDQPAALPGADVEFSFSSMEGPGTPPAGLTFTAIRRPIAPVTFSPQAAVFTETAKVTLTSATPGVEIRYTLDGREPDASSLLYTAPLTITNDTYIRARAFRPGVKQIPFTTAGTEVTVVSDARYHRRATKPAATAPAKLAPGLRWELVEGNWFALFSHLQLPAVMPAKASGETRQLIDVSMRQSDGPFGVRYDGFLNVPAAGVWTFHAPPEYVGASCEPGYDLRVWLDGEEWDPGQRHHGRGLWSVPLAQGLHRLQVTFADARHRDRTVHGAGLWGGYPSPWVVWKGAAPVLEISGPGFAKQPIPSDWLRRAR
jgi:hypothetical protein